MTDSQTSKDLVERLLKKRAGPYAPIAGLFKDILPDLRSAVGIPDGSLQEVIFNSLNQLQGRGRCCVCSKETKLYPTRGGWAKYCGKSCMNSSTSTRHVKSEATKKSRGTHISSPGVRNKTAETVSTKYGVSNVSQSKQVQATRKQTFQTKYGVDSAFCIPAVQEKIRKTMHQVYGGTGVSSPAVLEKINDTRRANILTALKTKLVDWEILSETFDGAHAAPLRLRHKCGLEQVRYVWTGQHLFDPLCKVCHGSSKPQRAVFEFLKARNITALVNDRSTIAPRELDIILPDHKIAIEVNGVHWHGERGGKDNKYHISKTLLCEQQGFQLLHITDVDILKHPSRVFNMLSGKLGLGPRYHARKCDIVKPSIEQAKDFMNAFHMQGDCKSQYRIGLTHQGELVALATFGRPRFSKKYDWELLRLAFNGRVIGGASKLITHAQRELNGSIVSYADRRWSIGKLYDRLGFNLSHVTKPGYWYVSPDHVIHHRTRFQRHTLGDSDLSEREIMLARGFDRMWDCGSLCFVLSN